MIRQPNLTNTLDITFYVPCYNEEALVASTLTHLKEALVQTDLTYEVIVVDDCSTDRTSDEVKRWQEQNPECNVILVRNEKNRGFARGFIDTAFRGNGEYYRTLCGDDPEPVATLLQMLKHVGKADMILPYYNVLPGKSKLRTAISHTYTYIVNIISGYRIHYYNGCGIHRRYNVMRWGPYSFGFGFQAELVTRLLDEGATYLEICVDAYHHNKPAGQSALNFGNFLSVAHTLVEIGVRRIRRDIFQK